MQKKTQRADISGVILLDKPQGMSSNRALQKVRNLYQAKKGGHTGALDPLATGILPICLGQATKTSEYLLHCDKAYEAVLQLGAETDTYDAEGKVTAEYSVQVTQSQLDQRLEPFRGDFKQVPPIYSALKVNGQPLYKLARQAKDYDLEKKIRDVSVYELNAELIADDKISLTVHCSGGFYVRSLAFDLGRALGCGAHIAQLRRTKVKNIHLDQTVGLDTLEALSPEELASRLLASDTLIADFPVYDINFEQALTLFRGQSVTLEAPLPAIEKEQLVRLYRPKTVAISEESRVLFAIASISENGEIRTRKIFTSDDLA